MLLLKEIHPYLGTFFHVFHKYAHVEMMSLIGFSSCEMMLDVLNLNLCKSD